MTTGGAGFGWWEGDSIDRLFPCGYSVFMQYELRSTEHFNRWLSKVRDKTTRARIFRRLDAIAMGSFGDHKALAANLFELRLFFGPGYRIYYTVKGKEIVFLLVGGDKSTQVSDIAKAAELLKELED